MTVFCAAVPRYFLMIVLRIEEPKEIIASEKEKHPLPEKIGIDLKLYALTGVLHGQPKDVPRLRAHHQPAPLQENHGHDGRQHHRRGGRQRRVRLLHRCDTQTAPTSPQKNQQQMHLKNGIILSCFSSPHSPQGCGARGEGDAGGDIWASAAHRVRERPGRSHQVHQQKGKTFGPLRLHTR